MRCTQFISLGAFLLLAEGCKHKYSGIACWRPQRYERFPHRYASFLCTVAVNIVAASMHKTWSFAYNGPSKMLRNKTEPFRFSQTMPRDHQREQEH